MRSTRSFSRARTDAQRGYVLIIAIALAVLYFGLIQLLLLDSARELSEARRFKARVVAQTLAENGAELAALQMATQPMGTGRADDFQGSMEGRYSSEQQYDATNNITRTLFIINASGKTKGVIRQGASVKLEGEIDAATKQIKINYARHSQ